MPPYEPDYCSQAIEAIEDVMAEVRRHLKVANIDQPFVDVEHLAQSIPSATKAGIGDEKRAEVRRLLLEGVPHKEVVRLSGVGSGTVSVLRKEIRKSVALYRN